MHKSVRPAPPLITTIGMRTAPQAESLLEYGTLSVPNCLPSASKSMAVVTRHGSLIPPPRVALPDLFAPHRDRVRAPRALATRLGMAQGAIAPMRAFQTIICALTGSVKSDNQPPAGFAPGRRNLIDAAAAAGPGRASAPRSTSSDVGHQAAIRMRG